MIYMSQSIKSPRNSLSLTSHNLLDQKKKRKKKSKIFAHIHDFFKQDHSKLRTWISM